MNLRSTPTPTRPICITSIGIEVAWRPLEHRLGETIGAVHDQQQTDGTAQISRVHVGEQHRSDRNADGAANDEWRKRWHEP